MKNKNLEISIFLFTLAIYGLLLIPSYFSAFARDEGALTSDNDFIQLFSYTFDILRFPTHTLFWPLISSGGILVFTLGFVINAIMYGLFFMKVAMLLKKVKFSNKNT